MATPNQPTNALETDDRGIVTPEAVVLEFDTAGVATRGVGFILDLCLQLFTIGVVLAGLGLISAASGFGETLFIIVALLVAFAVLFGYPAVMETFWGGRTLGHAAMGLRAVTREGAPVRFRHASIRSIFRIIEGIVLVGAPAVLSMIFTRRDQRVGDLVAGTLVLRERSSAQLPVTLTIPPPVGYEAYVASLDVTAIDERQYALIRSFLTRVLDLSPQARATLAVRLANPVAVRMAHTPPEMIGAELFLACVAAAYQQRHHAGPI